ncbi:MAG: L-threonylcarbamoyladenylate synthase [Candidatus Altiarchaeota archaeon]
MRVIRADPVDSDDTAILEAASVVLGGGVIVYPTDTVYGIGCVLGELAVRRVYAIKGRGSVSPLSVAFSSVEEVRHYTNMTRKQEEYVRKEHTNGMTFILEKKEIPDYVTAGLKTVGVRILDNNVCRKLIQRTGPLITTSANLSGGRAPTRVEEIDREVAENVDLILDGGPCKIGRPSRVIDLTRGYGVLRD